MSHQPMPHPGGFDRDRDREMDERRHRDHEEQLARERDREQDRDRERDRDREQNERANREPYPPGAAHHSSAAALELHQPVASRVPGAIHNPNGILANHGGPVGAGTSGPPQAAAPSGGFGGPTHNGQDRAAPPNGQNGQASMQHQAFAPMSGGPPNGPMNAASGPGANFGPPPVQEGPRGGAQAASFPGQASAAYGMAAASANNLPQAQQPILNDALSYLDQVKVQFSEQPDVYNRFLDIMKDFKSQTIDTPGVISRVSELFAGHPNLIQGFNTFLPPGYRIECGLENNPNSIRVTTPSGSTIHSIGTGRPLQLDGHGPAGAASRFNEHTRPGTWQSAIHHSIESPEAHFSQPTQAGQPPFTGTAAFDHSPTQQHRTMHAAAAGGAAQRPSARDVLTPGPSAAQVLNGAQEANSEKKGPIEFNHAISYVNKIKNRFQDKPETYKTFLEILQTYQREQKPIQEVYAQVTTLFDGAPDLLDDFKQFLPNTAGRNARPSVFGGMADLDGRDRTPQPGVGARDGPKMPPVGNFAPPGSAVKENKKRSRNDKSIVGMANSEIPTSHMRGGPAPAGSNKRIKTGHGRTGVANDAWIEPTLTPMMPEPLAPIPFATASLDDIQFFEKVKKHINNKTALADFFKLLNLYTMDLIDKDTLIHKTAHFIGGHQELFTFFKNFMNYTGEDTRIENKPAAPTGRVSLSNCRAYGPSYRLLPKRERLKPCSGRDELCNSVLNDDWASHPTWASEDSGFVAHRKNGYEEGLHRIEEERHDYDFYIELNQKCIQLLEPIAHQILALPPPERPAFRMPPNLGGQSSSIYKRTFKRIYGVDMGQQVVSELFLQPYIVLPIVLARLKQKDEEWRFTQREWEKVWQAQTAAMHLKSLDHMGNQIKANDKKHYSAKYIVDLIKAKYEQQRRSLTRKVPMPRYQFSYSFDDSEVLLDLLRLIELWVINSGQHSSSEKDRIIEFFETFIAAFFEIAEEKVQERVADIDRDSGDEDADESGSNELTSGRASRRLGKRSDLLRGVLDPSRNGSKARAAKDDDGTAASKATTPDGGSVNEEEPADSSENVSLRDFPTMTWLTQPPIPTVLVDGELPATEAQGLSAERLFPRRGYNLYANATIYVLFSVLQALYQRLKDVKENIASVEAQVKREKLVKPAKGLGMSQEDLGFFDKASIDDIWPRTMELIEDFITGEVDENRFQDIMRHYYLANGWSLYTIQDLIKTLARTALTCNGIDAKEKTPDLIRRFLDNRAQDETSYAMEIASRKFAEKCIRDGDIFVITWHTSSNEATTRWLPHSDTTIASSMDELDPRDKWQYYVSSWMRLEPTENIDRSRMMPTILHRNIQEITASSESALADLDLAALSDKDVQLQVCVNSFKLGYVPGTEGYSSFKDSVRRKTDQERATEIAAQEAAAAAAGAAGAAGAEKKASENASGDETSGTNDTSDAAPTSTAPTSAPRSAPPVLPPTSHPAQQRRKSSLANKEERKQALVEKFVMNNKWMKNLSQEDVQGAKEVYMKWKNDGDVPPRQASAEGEGREGDRDENMLSVV